MKKAASIFLLFLVAGIAYSQTTSGTIIFVRTIQFQQRAHENEARAMNMPSQIEDEFELLFDKDHSYFRPSLIPDALEGNGSGGGRRMRFMGSGETYLDFPNQRKVSQHELGDDVYIVDETIPAQAWKLTNETKEVMGYTCRKATTTREFKRMSMEVVDGKPTRKEVQDTASIVAWYTEKIPVPSGPEFAGTLPGMILELDMGDGRISFVASSFRKKYEKKALVAPKGTLINKDELDIKREEYFKKMREMWHGSH